MDKGDFVTQELKGDKGKIIVYGVVEEAHDDGTITYREAYAQHEVWGGSTGARGQLHHRVKESDLKTPTSYGRHLIKSSMKTKVWKEAVSTS